MMATAKKLCQECFNWKTRLPGPRGVSEPFLPNRGWHVCWNLEECECEGPHYTIVPSRDTS